MHEMGIVRSVVEVTLDAAQQAGATEVRKVCLTVGYGRDVVENLMQGLFRRLAAGTIAEGAELEITRVPVTARCNSCGTVFPLNLYRQDTWCCPACGAHMDYAIQTGMEFFISNIEVAQAASEHAAVENVA